MSAYLFDKIDDGDLVAYLPPLVGLLHKYRTGSRVICDPPVLDTDEDFLLYVEDLDQANKQFAYYRWLNCFEDWLSKGDTVPATPSADGYSAELEGGARFSAWRLGKYNVIVTDDEALHIRSVAATLLAKELNLTDKSDRIQLFRAVKYGENYGGRLP